MKFYIKLIFCIFAPFLVSRCHELKGFEDTILYKIEWPGDVEKTFDPKKYESLEVTTKEREKYRCMIPQALNKEEGRHSIDTSLSPLHFITPIFSSSSCSYRIEAYWAYEICHGHHVKQYHEEREGKNIKIQEYYLGKWDSTKTEQLHQKIVENQKLGRKLKYTKIDNVKYPYLEIEMSDGTLCDINNEPRVTRVRYVCYPHGKNEVYTLKETSTCNYEAVILTSVLCMHPSFLPEDSDENVISCLPVGESPERPYSWLLNEIDNMKVRHKQISDMFNPKEKIAILKIDPKDGTMRMDFIQNNFDEKLTNKEIANEEIDEIPTSNLHKKTHTLKDTTPVNEFLEGKNCLTGGTGWWKYEFCYGRYVRQFHVDKSGEISLILGFYDETLHKAWLKQNPEKRPKPKNIRTDVSHLYQGGTICDKTGEKRQTEVKLKCLDNVSSPSTVSMYLLEPKTCQYILVIESPLICDILQRADDNGLVPRDNSDETLHHDDPARNVYIKNVQIEDIEVRYEND